MHYIKQEKLDDLKNQTLDTINELNKADRVQIEKDIRELTGLDEKPEEPVVLDLESIRIIKPGKFEIDLVNLFSKKRPIIYKFGEGKYIIDLSSSIKTDEKELKRKIRNPDFVIKKEKEREIEKKEEIEDKKKD